MIERNIPRDITKYETKLLGPFTTRQLICMVPGLGLAVASYFLLRGLMGDSALFISVCIGVPFLLAGWWKPYGMPFEKYVYRVLLKNLLAPTKRKYKTKLSVEGLVEEEIVCKPSEKKKKSNYRSADKSLKALR